MMLCMLAMRNKGLKGKCKKAFLLLADVMDMLASVHMNIITPDMLQRSIDSFLQACIACGWGKHLHQKFHWVLHLPSHLQKFKLLPACWVQHICEAVFYCNFQHNNF